VAAASAEALGRALRIAAKGAAWLALALGLFMLAAWIGSAIPRNSGWTEPAAGVPIMVETNGVHTAIVMPLVTPQKDWRTEFPAADLPGPPRPYTHVSVSWGERAVFLETPTWADHVAHDVRPAPSDSARVVRLRPAEYARLVAAIESQLSDPSSRKAYPGYEDWDVFYNAPGRYHFANTCNQWTSDTLAFAGVKAGWWTPFAGGVMKWMPRPSLADQPLHASSASR
jgi:uncharacterized protein (TIGR02117 family)